MAQALVDSVRSSSPRHVRIRYVCVEVALCLLGTLINNTINHRAGLASTSRYPWLWVTVAVANFAEAMARAAASLRPIPWQGEGGQSPCVYRGRRLGEIASVSSAGDLIYVEATTTLPATARSSGRCSVDDRLLCESARSSGDRRRPLGRHWAPRFSRTGSRCITSKPGETLPRPMIPWSRAYRRRPPQIALSICSGLTSFSLLLCTFTLCDVLPRPQTVLLVSLLSADSHYHWYCFRPSDCRMTAGPYTSGHEWESREAPATSTPCCSTRPALSLSATAGTEFHYPLRGHQSCVWPTCHCLASTKPEGRSIVVLQRRSNIAGPI